MYQTNKTTQTTNNKNPQFLAVMDEINENTPIEKLDEYWQATVEEMEGNKDNLGSMVMKNKLSRLAKEQLKEYE